MKRILLMVLVTGMALLAFACADPDEADGGARDYGALFDENGGAEYAPEGGEPAEPSPFTPANANFDGYNFRILGFDSYQGMWVSVSYSEVYAEELTGVPINDAIFHRNAAVEALYNINISLVPLSYGARGAHADTALRSIRAGEDAFDAALMIGNQIPRMMSTANALVDLRSIDTMDLSNQWWDQTSVSDLSIGGRSFVATGDMSLYSAFGTVVMFFNKQMVADYGLDDPYRLVREGAWTWDALYNMGRTVARDVNGDGLINHHDIVGIMAEPLSLMYSVQAGGVRLTEKDAYDMPVLVGNSPRLTAAIDTILGVLRSPVVGVNVDLAPGGFGNPFFGWALPKFIANEALFFYNQLHVALNLREMEADFGILPAPKIDELQDGHFSVANEWFITYLFVPQTNFDLDRTGIILEALGYYSGRYVMPAFYDVTVTHQLARDEDSVEMLDIILNNRVYDLANIYNWGDMMHMFRAIYDTNNNNIAARFEAREGVINAHIERTLGEIIG